MNQYHRDYFPKIYDTVLYFDFKIKIICVKV